MWVWVPSLVHSCNKWDTCLILNVLARASLVIWKMGHTFYHFWTSTDIFTWEFVYLDCFSFLLCSSLPVGSACFVLQKSLFRVKKLYLQYLSPLLSSISGLRNPLWEFSFPHSCKHATEAHFRFLVLNRFLHCSLLQLFLVMHLPVVTKVKLAMIRQ